MCEVYSACQTLFRASRFYWKLDNDDVYTVRSNVYGPTTYTFSEALYAASHEFIYNQPNGTPLGARGNGEIPPDSLGAWLQLQGKPRPLASFLAAIAVAEGIFQFENLGSGTDRGVRLYPILDEPGLIANHVGEEMIINPGQAPDIDLPAAATAIGLRELAQRVELSQPPERIEYTFELGQLSATEQPQLINDIRTWEGAVGSNRYIYRFTVEDESTAARLHECLKDTKSSVDNTRKYSRVNTPSANSLCMYVGSSRSITQRMRDHLGYSSAGIYSLHLRTWQDLPDVNMKIEILKYPADIGQDVLQAIEDGIWQSSKPMFGKQGAK